MGAKLSDSGADWDAYQQASGRARIDRPKCRQCGEVIRDDAWKGGPVVGYLCSACDERDRISAHWKAHLQEIVDLAPKCPWPVTPLPADAPTSAELVLRYEDWRLSDSPEAAAERARFEKEQGE